MAAKKQIIAVPTSLLVVVGALIAIAYFHAFHPSEGRKSCIASCTGFETGLELETKYYYKCGDSCLGAMSEELVFETLPFPGSGNYPTRIAFVGDLDLTSNSTTTVDHFILLLLRDLTYANQYLSTGGRSCYPCEFPDSTRDTYQPRWDGWGRTTSRLNQSSICKHSVIKLSSILYIISIKLHIQLRSCTRFMLPITSSVPMMVIEGNHKVSRLGVEPYDIEEADQKCKRMVCRDLFRVFEGPDYCSIVSRLLKEDTELFGNKYVSISELGTVYSDGIVIFSVTTSRDQQQQRDGDELEESDGGEKEVDDRRPQQQRDGDEIEESDEGEKDVDDRRQQQQRDGDELEESDEGEDRRQPWHARLMELLPRGRTEENQMSLEEQLQRHLAETHRRVGAEEEQRRRVPWYICLLAILPCVEADSMVPHRDQREWVSRGRRFLVVVGVLAFFVLMYFYEKTQGRF